MAVCSLSVPSRLFWLLALLALLSGPAHAGRDAEYSIDKVYTTSNVWSISINVTRKSCAMSTLREDFSMMAIGGDYRGSMPSFYLMFANRSWGEEDGKTYDVEMEYGGGKTWTGGGIGLDLMRVRGIAIEDIGDVFFNQFSGVTSIKLKVDGQSRGEFVLENVEKAFRKLTECMRSVSSGVISLEKIKEGFGVERAGKPLIAEDHGDWSKPVDRADATPQGQDKVSASDADPAPSVRADQGSAPDKDRNSHQEQDSRTPVLGAEYFLNENYYDRRNGWLVSINKARMSCNISKLFDTKSLIQLGGDAHGSEYSFYLMFQDEKFFLEEGKKHSVSVTFNGRSTWDAEGLGVSLANGVLGVTLEHINKDSIVEFAGMSVLDLKIDGVSSGTYSLAGTRKALLRMLDCIKDIEAGRISLATIGEGNRSTDDRAPSTSESPDRRGGQGEKKGQGAGTSYAYGTGFFVNGDGYLLTNAHVVEGCKDALVRQGHSDVQPATIVAREVTNDLAILKVAEKSPVFGKFRGAPQIRLGDSIVVFGYPLAGMLSSTGNLSTGLISSLTGAGDDVSKLQISAPVQSGNSGGAVVDQSGRIVGVVVAKANIQTRGTEDKPDVEVIQNVNFAIKAGMAQFFLDANQIHYEAEAPGDDLKTPDVADIARSFTVQVACEMRK